MKDGRYESRMLFQRKSIKKLWDGKKMKYMRKYIKKISRESTIGFPFM